MSTLLGLCGSLRAGSLNRKLMLEAGRLYGASVIDADLRLPLYDGDLEEAEGLPAAVATLAAQVAAADAVLIVTPEYNKAPSGVLKNALDWVSRSPDKPWAGKPVAVMSATAGRSGGERAQSILRLFMLPLGADVLVGPEVLVGSAHTEFDEDGRLGNEINLAALQTLMDALRAKTA